jgi:type I restriction enzyme, S subunit
MFKKGQILFPKLRPYLNKVHHAEFDGLCSTEFHIVDSKAELAVSIGSGLQTRPYGNSIDNRYLAHFLRSKVVVSQTKYLMSGNTLPRLQTEDIHKLLIPVPPHETQQTIIHIFENAYAEKKAKEAQAKALLASIDGYLLEELGITLPEKQANTLKNRVFLRNISQVSGGRFDGYYHGEFFERLPITIKNGHYPTEKLETLCLKITDGTHYTPTYVSSGVPFISVKNVRRSTISFEDIKYITKEEHLDLTKRAKPEPNDILLTKIGTIGLSAVIPHGLPDFSIFVSVALLKPFESVNSYFLSEVISSPIVLNQFERDLKGTGVPDLHLENICKVNIPLPPLEIQEKIVAEITTRREQAKRLQTEAKTVLENAKIEVERMILGGGEDD